ncbi:hypothetical protein EGW08_020041 [Elysia chlorotica]|uniref:ZSWIM3 N-terminal domain-containing protein n=1 Tax=Elysia chlorotica TaxID=188477 RepID=A0A433SSE7_ELYCH|nr:hypothetical protein EGW08_020041 [Elysia chlorotica]
MADQENENQGNSRGLTVVVESDQENSTPLVEAAISSPHKETVAASDQDATNEEAVQKSETEANSPTSPPYIVRNAEFTSFLQLRDAIEKYQKENCVQLIVKDSKLLKAESTRKVIPKVYHLVNQDLMYHSITYTCKCHGELRQRPGTRMKNVGQKRLNCPVYIRLKLSPDLQRLVLFDLYEEHNHEIDRTTCQMTPRQQVYHLSRMKRKRARNSGEGFETMTTENSISFKSDLESCPSKKSVRLDLHPHISLGEPMVKKETEESEPQSDETGRDPAQNRTERSESPLDSASSSCCDSDEEEVRNNSRLLPFPIRLIGSAITCNPELIASTKELLDIQKSKLNLERQKLLMETKLLELTNTKLELEIRQLQKSLTSESSQHQDTTIYLQAP